MTKANFTSWIHDLHLLEKDPLLLAALGFAVLAILLALLGLRRSKTSGSQYAFSRLSTSVQELELKLKDMLHRREQDVNKLQNQFLQLEQRLARFEEKFHLLPGDTSLTPESKEVDKKKSDLTSRPSLLIDDTSSHTADVGELFPREPLAEPRKLDRVSGTEKLPLQETPGFFSGLKKTREHFFSRLTTVFRSRADSDQQIFDELEELLLASDLGIKFTQTLLSRLRETFSKNGNFSPKELRQLLREAIFQILSSDTALEIVPKKKNDLPLVVLMVGVNGVGKTTMIAKLAHRFHTQGAKVLLGAGDTFRAAATEQLTLWANDIGVEIVTGPEGAKPTTVAFQAIEKAVAQNFDVLLIDTAGRLHTRVNLMNELESMINILRRHVPDAPHETLLVLDASTGQNALQQAKEFHERCQLTGIVITKLDGTPKGGIVVAIKNELGIPIRYVGMGEGVGDLRTFSAEEFVKALLEDNEDNGNGQGSQELVSTRGQVRRKRREELAGKTSTDPVLSS